MGVMGVANAIEAIVGHTCYGEPEFLSILNNILKTLKNECYRTSALLAKSKGSFPLYNRDLYMRGKFIQTLDDDVKELIYKYGIRNSHLTSIAPTGTISLTANNVSSGIEPVVAYEAERLIQEFDAPKRVTVRDFGYDNFGIKGKVIKDVTVKQHIDTLLVAQKHIDSGVSKTCNVPKNISWENFKLMYMDAWKGGAKGCTTYRFGCKRGGILTLQDDDISACYFDPETGRKECN